MNVLFISHYSKLYGANRSLLDLIDGLKKFSIRPFVISPNSGDLGNELALRNVPHEILPVVRWDYHGLVTNYRRKITLRKLIESIPAYKNIIKDWDIDILYTNTSVSPVGRLAALLTWKPHIWHIREFLDLDYGKYFIYPKWIESKIIGTSQAIICNSEAVKEHFFNRRGKKVNVVYNGVATEKAFKEFRNFRRNYIPINKFTFAIIGAVNPTKGQDIAIKAIAQLVKNKSKVRLIIAGDGLPFLDYCKKLVKSLQIEDYVQFTGFVNDPYQIYLQSDCLLVCSKNEAMGRVTVEGMSACLPVIARNSGGSPEIVLHGQTGYLFNKFDDLIGYMKLFENNPQRAKLMGFQGWEFARKRFSIEKYSKNIFNIIKSL